MKRKTSDTHSDTCSVGFEPNYADEVMLRVFFVTPSKYSQKTCPWLRARITKPYILATRWYVKTDLHLTLDLHMGNNFDLWFYSISSLLLSTR